MNEENNKELNFKFLRFIMP